MERDGRDHHQLQASSKLCNASLDMYLVHQSHFQCSDMTNVWESVFFFYPSDMGTYIFFGGKRKSQIHHGFYKKNCLGKHEPFA